MTVPHLLEKYGQALRIYLDTLDDCRGFGIWRRALFLLFGIPLATFSIGLFLALLRVAHARAVQVLTVLTQVQRYHASP